MPLPPSKAHRCHFELVAWHRSNGNLVPRRDRLRLGVKRNFMPNQERWSLHVAAKGPLAVVAAIIIIFVIAHRPGSKGYGSTRS